MCAPRPLRTPEERKVSAGTPTSQRIVNEAAAPNECHPLSSLCLPFNQKASRAYENVFFLSNAGTTIYIYIYKYSAGGAVAVE